MGVSAAEFVRNWQASESAEEVAYRTGMRKQTVLVRAGVYRRKGVKLKRHTMKLGTSKIDVDSLNKIILNNNTGVHGTTPKREKKKSKKPAK